LNGIRRSASYRAVVWRAGVRQAGVEPQTEEQRENAKVAKENRPDKEDLQESA